VRRSRLDAARRRCPSGYRRTRDPCCDRPSSASRADWRSEDKLPAVAGANALLDVALIEPLQILAVFAEHTASAVTVHTDSGAVNVTGGVFVSVSRQSVMASLDPPAMSAAIQ
jgi:hypothetical protein